MTDDEVGLLVAWQGGDHVAGGTLLRRYFAVLQRFFARKVDAVVVDDLTQRTFEAISRRRDDVEPTASFRAFLFGVARVELLRHLDEWRRRGSRFDPLEVSLEALGAGAVSVLGLAEQHARVLRALHELPLDFQIAVELHYFQDLSLQEIAEALRVPVGTVKSRLSRGRALLGTALELPESDDGVVTALREARPG